MGIIADTTVTTISDLDLSREFMFFGILMTCMAVKF